MLSPWHPPSLPPTLLPHSTVAQLSGCLPRGSLVQFCHTLEDDSPRNQGDGRPSPHQCGDDLPRDCVSGALLRERERERERVVTRFPSIQMVMRNPMGRSGSSSRFDSERSNPHPCFAAFHRVNTAMPHHCHNFVTTEPPYP